MEAREVLHPAVEDHAAVRVEDRHLWRPPQRRAEAAAAARAAARAAHPEALPQCAAVRGRRRDRPALREELCGRVSQLRLRFVERRRGIAVLGAA